MAWFGLSAAVLLGLPLIYEVQRETTVYVLQRRAAEERERIVEDAKRANLSVFDQVKALGQVAAHAVGPAQ